MTHQFGVAVLEKGRQLHLTIIRNGTHRIYKTIRVWEAGTKRPELHWKVMYEFRRQGKRLYLSPNFIIMGTQANKLFDSGYAWNVEYVEAHGFGVHAARAKANINL